MLYNEKILYSTKHCLFSHIGYTQKSGLHMYNRIVVYTKTHLDIITPYRPGFVVATGGCGWPCHCVSFLVKCHERIRQTDAISSSQSVECYYEDNKQKSKNTSLEGMSTVIPVALSWTQPLLSVVGFVDDQIAV